MVDAFCICDTGSTDNTREISTEFLTTHPGNLTTCEWKDFGYNRTQSFVDAQTYVRDTLKWDTHETYGLLLDADMIFVPGTLRDQKLDAIGYTILQQAGNLIYPNCRLVRMDHPWVCKGVTHEYWDGTITGLPKSVCHILDQNDGGCKADKFERDIRLLEKGLQDEPGNVRYMFYLAQSYNSVGRWKEAIAMYKKRITAGGWLEEVWYSHYMIGNIWLSLKNPIKFEEWMLKAHAYRPSRAEALYKLTKYFREAAHHYKAYHYLELGSKLPMSTDSLFIERDVYSGLFEYERSILDYYVKQNDGMVSSVRYLLKMSDHRDNVLSNMKFYANPIGTISPLSLPSPFGDTFKPSAISVKEYPFANVRYINYWIENGEYKTPDNCPVQTENAYINLETNEVIQKMNDASVGLPKRETHVRGLEDIRLYDRYFTATVQEYSEGVSILQGIYNTETGTYDECEVLKSPFNKPCEKNWLPVPGTSHMIYDWYPLRVFADNVVVHKTPPLFSMFRGSAPPIRVHNSWWVLVHFVEYSKPRSYYHCFVVLDDDYKPLRVSIPFVFNSVSIEYCVSVRLRGEELVCYTSFMDKDPAEVTIGMSELQWASVEVSDDTSN